MKGDDRICGPHGWLLPIRVGDLNAIEAQIAKELFAEIGSEVRVIP